MKNLVASIIFSIKHLVTYVCDLMVRTYVPVTTSGIFFCGDECGGCECEEEEECKCGEDCKE